MGDRTEEQTPSIEETFARIEEIIERMEQPEVTLDESFGLYQKGVEQLGACAKLLDEMEKKMQVLNAEGSLEEF